MNGILKLILVQIAAVFVTIVVGFAVSALLPVDGVTAAAITIAICGALFVGAANYVLRDMPSSAIELERDS